MQIEAYAQDDIIAQQNEGNTLCKLHTIYSVAPLCTAYSACAVTQHPSALNALHHSSIALHNSAQYQPLMCVCAIAASYSIAVHK
jgi:hypothetical protein